MRYELANLGAPPTTIFIGDGVLGVDHRQWVQATDRWMAIYYQHINYITINAQGYGVEPGDIAFYSPGSKGSHAQIGSACPFNFVRFDLPASTGYKAAIPQVVRGQNAVLPDLRRAADRVIDTTDHARAFVWNLVCAVSQTTAVLRGNELLYEAEAFIRRHLADKISIPSLAESLESSPRQLLRAFRAEYGITVQEYILRQRIQEAARLLLNTDLTIKEIANRTGYGDLHHFNKAMRQTTGLAPREYRRVGRVPLPRT
jgi:AraC-like DNA-binding protein